jgi:hypothetical protein
VKKVVHQLAQHLVELAQQMMAQQAESHRG